MLAIKHLEMHAVHSCNLACVGCSHYSDQGHKGVVQLEEAEAWMRPWGQRLRPEVFSLVGGEPSLHPRLPQLLRLARACFPRAGLRLVSNGFFLHRHPELPLALREVWPARLFISIHHDAAEYRERMLPVYRLIDEWKARHGIEVEFYTSWQRWTRRYHGKGAAMLPFADANPRASWENCVARHAPQLFEGALWKCAALAYLPMQNAKYRLAPDWAPYLVYAPLAADCSEAELHAFFARKEEVQCGMCPAQPPPLALPLPLVER